MTDQAIRTFKSARSAGRHTKRSEGRWSATRLYGHGVLRPRRVPIPAMRKYGGGSAESLYLDAPARSARERSPGARGLLARGESLHGGRVQPSADFFGGGGAVGWLNAADSLSGRLRTYAGTGGQMMMLLSNQPFGAAVAKTSALSSPPNVSVSERDAPLYEAAESLRQAAVSPKTAVVGRTASLLYRAAHAEADRRPRHAAIALAAWDAIQCTDEPFGTQGRRMVLWEANRLLMSQFISTEDEMKLLDRMDAVDLDRVPPFEDTVVGAVFEQLHGDSLR